ncbi:unnamed protein product [Chrysoparadoxa australica]
MLYSSSKLDLKQGLGLGYFTEGEYYASEKSELTWEAFQHSRDDSNQDELLTERERIQKEMNQRDRGTAANKSTAMGFIPFDLTPELSEQFEAFKKGDVNWIEVCMAGESLSLVLSKLVAANEALAPLVSDKEPRFILLKRKGQTIFVYSCPECAPVREKMLYSSSRASAIAATDVAGIKTSKAVEIRESADIDDAICEDAGAAARQSGNPPSTGSVAKPSRPGRGRARLTKKRP